MNALSAIVSALHVLALAIGLPAIFLRARALRAPLDRTGLARVLAADNAWGIAAVLWLATGLARAFGPLEKGSAYYLGNGLFHAKLGLFGLILLLELWPMVTLIRWRLALARGATPDPKPARAFAVISDIETAIVLILPFVAAFMARGFGVRS